MSTFTDKMIGISVEATLPKLSTVICIHAGLGLSQSTSLREDTSKNEQGKCLQVFIFHYQSFL
jgi:hypothetical protein